MQRSGAWVRSTQVRQRTWGWAIVQGTEWAASKLALEIAFYRLLLSEQSPFALILGRSWGKAPPDPLVFVFAFWSNFCVKKDRPAVAEDQPHPIFKHAAAPLLSFNLVSFHTISHSAPTAGGHVGWISPLGFKTEDVDYNFPDGVSPNFPAINKVFFLGN